MRPLFLVPRVVELEGVHCIPLSSPGAGRGGGGGEGVMGARDYTRALNQHTIYSMATIGHTYFEKNVPSYRAIALHICTVSME